MRVIFYPPNELPVSENFFRGKRLHVVGDKPGWRTDDDWNAYLAKLQGFDSTVARRPGENLVNPTNFYGDGADTDQETLMLVEQSPRALVDLAMATATSVNPDLARTRKLLADRKTTPEIDVMIDGIIATKILTADNEIQRPDASDTSAEALAVLAFQGDTEAQALIASKQRQLAEYDKEHNIVDINQPVALSPTERDLLNRMSTVHVTKYLPQTSEDGSFWDIPTTFDANPNIRIPRITWHTTLQERTGENVMAMGSAKFAGTPYALITRFGSVVEANGKPLSYSADDTFFEISPGRRVKLPKKDAILIKPGNPTIEGAIFQRNDATHEVIYKHAGFTPEDIEQICGTKNDGLREVFGEALRGQDRMFEISDEAAKDLFEKLGGRFYYQNEIPQVSFQTDDTSLDDKLLDELKTMSIPSVIEIYLPVNTFPGPQGDDMRARCASMLEQVISSKSKDAAIKAVTEEFRDGFDNSGDKSLADVIDKLDLKYGGKAGHWNSSSGLIEGGIMRNFGALYEGKTSQQDLHKSRGNVSNLTPAMRKMYYYLGLI